jgi:anti-anti-sigma factor
MLILVLARASPTWGGKAMTPSRDTKLAAAGQQTPSTSPQLDEAGAALARPRSGLVVITLPPEIDVANDGQVQDSLTRALDAGTAVLVADAGGTTFCGCSGVHALTRTHHSAAAAGAQLRVVASPAIRRIMTLTGADHLLDAYPTLAVALAEGPG